MMRRLSRHHPDAARAQTLPELLQEFTLAQAALRREAERAVAEAMAPLVVAVLERLRDERIPVEQLAPAVQQAFSDVGVAPAAQAQASASAYDALLRAVARQLDVQPR